MSALVHIAAQPIMVRGRYLRQLCGWCGHRLIDYDLTRVAVPAGQDAGPSAWPTGRQVLVDGNCSAALPDGDELDVRSCALLDTDL